MRRILVFAALPLLLAACGGKKAAQTIVPGTTTTSTGPGARTASSPTTTSGAGALQAEANAAATGDIPDNQVFLRFHGKGYSIKYPEGWAQSGAGATTTFRDKNNIVRVVVRRGAKPTPASARHEVEAFHGLHLTSSPKTISVSGAPAIHLVYETRSTPNAVTGKTVTLGVDRYYLWKGGRVAIVDLGTPVKPVKVDNVDAYRLIIQSFRWR